MINNNKKETSEGRRIKLLRMYIDDVDNDLEEIGAEIAFHKKAQKERYEEKDMLKFLIAKLEERIEEKEEKKRKWNMKD